jgi:hypothetical protein
MDNPSDINGTAISAITISLGLAGYDFDSDYDKEKVKARNQLFALTEQMDAADLEEVIWKMAEWFGEILWIMHPEDPNSLMRRLGELSQTEA